MLTHIWSARVPVFDSRGLDHHYAKPPSKQKTVFFIGAKRHGGSLLSAGVPYRGTPHTSHSAGQLKHSPQTLLPSCWRSRTFRGHWYRISVCIRRLVRWPQHVSVKRDIDLTIGAAVREMPVAVVHPNMTRSSLGVSFLLTLFLLGAPITSVSDSSSTETPLSQNLDNSLHDHEKSDDVLSVIDEAFDSKAKYDITLENFL